MKYHVIVGALAVSLSASVLLTACGASTPAASPGRDALPTAGATAGGGTGKPEARAGSGELCQAIEKLDANAALRDAQEGAAGMKKAADTFDFLAGKAPADVAADLHTIAALYRKTADGQLNPETLKGQVGVPYQHYLTYVTKHCVKG